VGREWVDGVCVCMYEDTMSLDFVGSQRSGTLSIYQHYSSFLAGVRGSVLI
jgi:hypothetical protein